MNLRRLPVIPTLLVLVAVAVMLRLGIWQLDRMQAKAALIERYAAAQATSAEVAWPRGAAQAEALLYHRSRLVCLRVLSARAMAGRSAAGEAGQAHSVRCALPDGAQVNVVLGWSRDPAAPDWRGGAVRGTIAPGGAEGPRLIADPPLAGLGASARPDPSEIPNNHLSYAVQWFIFAATALVIYVLAVRKRLAAGGAPR